jgi:hypothetical protein
MDPVPPVTASTPGQPRPDVPLYEAAWPDMHSRLHVAYSELTRTRLKSGALAARMMEGSLSVHSDGEGRDATFTLDLPLKPVEDRI